MEIILEKRKRRLGWVTVDSALVVLRRRMCVSRFVVVHDSVMFQLYQMLEVGFDRFDCVLLTNQI